MNEILTERVALFVDGANMFFAQRIMGWHIEFRKLHDFFFNGKIKYNAFYYTGQTSPDAKDESFLRALTYMGYSVRTKQVKEIVDDETGQIRRKSNLDIEIAIDMISTSDQYDTAVLCSGDGDFERAIELLRARGKKIIVAAIKQMTAFELLNSCDRYIDLEELKPLVQKI